MKAYVVYCHPNPESFTAAVRERAVVALKAAGHEVRIVRSVRRWVRSGDVRVRSV